MKIMTEQMFAALMSDLFRVWEGTEKSEEILTDVCNHIGHHAFGMESKDLPEFSAGCREGFACYTICHNEDDYRDEIHRRVTLTVGKRNGYWRVFADGEPEELIPPCSSKEQALDAIVQTWCAPQWDLQRFGFEGR